MSADFAPIVLEGKRVLLRTPGAEDMSTLRQLETTGALASRWRFRGSTMSPEDHARTFWSGVLTQYLVIRRSDRAPVGFWVAYNPDIRNGFAYVAAAKFDPDDRSPLFLEGGILFFDLLFRAWPLRKLYMESPEFNMDQYQSAVGEMLQVEARLTERLYYDGSYWDELILSLSRSEWEGRAEAARRFVLG